MEADDQSTSVEYKPREQLADLVCDRLEKELSFDKDDLVIAKEMLSSGDLKPDSWESLIGKVFNSEEPTNSTQ